MRALGELSRAAGRWTKRLLRAKGGNAAMMFALLGFVVLSAAGGALDWSRAMVTKTRLGTALDAAALAVGTTNGLSTPELQTMAQQYFNAYYPSTTIGTPGPVHLDVSGQIISLSVAATVPTTLLKVARIDTLDLSVTNQVVRAVSKLRVALVLDNTGSMSETDDTGTSKMTALKNATHQLLTQLQGVAIKPGDVQVALIPFALDVNVGTAAINQNWIDWANWEAPPANSAPSNGVGPKAGSNTCPYTNAANGFKCASLNPKLPPTNDLNCNLGNNNTCLGTIYMSGPYKGYICPSAHNANVTTGGGGHFYNGCYDSQATTKDTQTCVSVNGGAQNCNTVNSPVATSPVYTGDSGPTTTNTTSQNVVCSGSGSCSCNSYTNCSCTGSGGNKVCTQTLNTATTVTISGNGPWIHAWRTNAHSTWTGCVMDRTQNYDTTNQAPTPGQPITLFPAENSAYCPPAALSGLSYNWTALNNTVDTMMPNGSTNQTIGFIWGWHALTQGAPMNASAADNYTSQVIIILSDGLNTQNRWNGDGSNQNSNVNNREALACANAKAAGVIVYTLFVDLNGTNGNSAPLQNCASDSSKYFDLTTSDQIVTAFNQIGTELANLSR